MPAVDRRERADLIVVGASVGGLVAAITAADRGLHVVVLERGRDLGGGAAASGEPIAAVGSRWQRDAGVRVDVEALAADLAAADVPAGAARALAAQSAGLVEWLADRCGAAIVLPRPGRWHVCAELGGASLVAALNRVVTRHHRIRVRPGSEVVRLLREDDGPIAGVAVKPDRRAAPNVWGPVLLACGGFVAEEARIAEHCPGAAGLPTGGPALATGDGLRFATEAGAHLEGLGRCEVTPLFALPAQLQVPGALASLGAILVNQAGQRFADEAGGDPIALAHRVRAQPGHVAYLVFDDRIAAQASADPFVEHVVLARAARRGATVGDLARQLELDADGLEAALAGRNLEPSYQAIRVTGARVATLGGAVVDEHARVLDPAGRPIPGLHATGGVVASPSNASGLAPLAALGLGRLAALDVIAAVEAAEAAAVRGA